MASRDTSVSSDNFQSKVLGVLRKPELFPPEMSSWIRSQIVRNPLVKLDSFQLPTLDRKHMVGGSADAAFLNAWVNQGGIYEPASFYKDNDQRVYLQGTVAGGTVGFAIFTLPPAYRPVAQLVFPVSANGLFGRLEIQASGNVILMAGATTLVSLSGVSFRTL